MSMAEEKKKKGKAKAKKEKAPKAKKTNQVGVPFVQSMRLKIVAMVVCSVIAIFVLNLLTMRPLAKNAIQTVVQNSMNSFMTSYAKSVEKIYDIKGGLGTMKYSEYDDILNEAKLDGMESSYIYLVNSQGLLIYHPDEAMVGQPASASEIVALTERIRSGDTNIEPGMITYEFQGKNQIAVYRVLSSLDIIVMTVDEEDVYSGVTTMLRDVSIYSIGGLVLVIILAAIVSSLLMKPLTQVSAMINELGDLKFVKRESDKKLIARKDECGMMAKAVDEMRQKLQENILEINHVSERLMVAVEKLQQSSIEINTSCTDNSATTQQLAAGMQETTATTEMIHMNIGNMRTESGEIQNLSMEGEKLSDEITSRAADLRNTSESAVETATKLFEKVKQDTENAIEESKAVDKINELTDVIMQISSQTSLLALNASIEAARAGEAGRGFAVVASEIGALADQTSAAVNNINDIVVLVNSAVNKMTLSMNQTTEFLEKNVLPDYENFAQVSDQYVDDANTVRTSMTTIQGSLNKLNTTIATIADGVEGINSTMNESASGITNIAEKTTDVVGKTSDNEVLVEDCQREANNLVEITGRFHME